MLTSFEGIVVKITNGLMRTNKTGDAVPREKNMSTRILKKKIFIHVIWLLLFHICIQSTAIL